MRLLFVLLIAIAGNSLNAQKNGTILKKITKTADTLQSLTKRIFPTRKMAGSKPAESTDDNALAGVYSASMSGDTIATGVVYLDAERLYQFNNGAAVMEKGTNQAMIDTKGRILVPYGRYSFIEVTRSKYPGAGLFPALDGAKAICLLATGKVIDIPGAEFIRLTEDGHYAVFRKNESSLVYIDKNDRRFHSSHWFSYITEGIGITSIEVKDNTERYSSIRSQKVFVRIKENKILGASHYHDIFPFSDGMAIVAVKDQFGTVTYGFIDSTGKEVIPPIYSEKPSDFKSGLAKVIPRNKGKFLYAFIDKKGNVVLKHAIPDIATTGGQFGPFTATGYAHSSTSVMDVSGRISPVKDFLLEKGGVKAEKNWTLMVPPEDKVDQYQNGFLRYFRKPSRNRDDYNYGGFVNLKTGKAVSPSFRLDDGSWLLVFDPVSRLATAVKFMGRDANGIIWRKGYINEDGEFVMLLKPKSEW